MKTRALSALLSIVVATAAALFLIGYGVTEEVPVGALQGTVVMAENGRPLPGAFLTMTEMTLPGLNDADEWGGELPSTTHHFQADKNGRFHLHRVMAGIYRLEVSSKAHSLPKKFVTISEGGTQDLVLSAEPKSPDLELHASQRVYTPGEVPAVHASGFMPQGKTAAQQPKMSVSIYHLDFDKVIKEGGMYNALAPLARSDENKPKDPSTMGSLLKTYAAPPSSLDAEGTFVENLPMTSLPEGLYWVQCKLNDLSRGVWLSVTKIAMVVKHTDRRALAYVVDLRSGQPVSGAAVGFGTPSGFVSQQNTGADGLSSFDTSKQGGNAVVIVASKGESKAISDFTAAVSESDSEGDEEDSGAGGSAQTRIYSYTDRPIYRPGDLVQFKGMVRRLVGSKYVLPKKNLVEVQILDQDGNQLQSQTLPLSSMGTYSGNYQFSADALPANYSLVTHYGKATASKDIGVAAYRKPTYSITVHPEKPSYIRGDIVRMDVDTKYYYGAPVVGASVTATVTRNPEWNYGDETDEQYYGDEASDQSYPGATTTSYSGEETQEIHTVTDSNGKAVIQFPTIGARESEEAESDFTYDVHVEVADQGNKTFDGDGSVEVLRSDESLKLDTDRWIVEAGKPFSIRATVKRSDRSPVQGAQVVFAAGFSVWQKNQELMVDQQTQTLPTDASGSCSLTLQPPGAGMYKIQATIMDDRGNKVTESQEIYLWGASPMPEGENPVEQLAVQLDKKQYKAGETAKALITCRDPGGTALVSVEGADVYTAIPVALNARRTVYQFKVQESFVPNAYVTVEYVRNKRYSESSKGMVIDLGLRKLAVKVTPAKPVYRPGETAQYTVSTRDANGKPVAAEVSLGVVDESIYAIFDDQSDIIKGFYPKRSDSVETLYSFPELYLGGGDKAPTNIQIRRNFKDTAYWNPVVDTNASGEAQVSVKLPDNITSWRATVRAITSDTAVGQATCNLIARKDLMVQLSGPTYLVSGDREQLVAMITNNTDSDADVKLNLTGANADVEGDTNSTVHVAKGAVQIVPFMFSGKVTGEADFVAKAWIPNGASDGMELKIPIRPHARLVTDGYAGSTSSSKTVTLTLDAAADRSSGGLDVTVAPSVAYSLLGSLDSLIDFPYGCVEQTTSRFLPTVVFAKTFKDLGLPRPKLEDKVPQIVQDGYARLEAMQHPDGGWGWWTYDDSDPYMTAYVLEALYRASNAGYPAPSGININKALDWAANYVNKPPVLADRQAAREAETSRLYLIYALALHGRNDVVKNALAKVNVFKLDAAQAAFAALSADKLGSEEESVRSAALSRMLFLVKETRSTAQWPEQDWWGYETSGRCFMALVTLKPDSPVVGKVVALLMQQRRGNLWYSTRDTSAILLAMAEYLKHSKELLSSSEIEVRLNGALLHTYSFAQGQGRDELEKLHIAESQLQPGPNQLQFVAKSGVCYYTASLKQYVVGDPLAPIPGKSGLAVSRAYYKLEAQRMQDGTLKLMPSSSPVTSYVSGDILRCDIKVHSDSGRSFLLIEDPTPSGMHVTDREEPDEGESWAYWWSRTVILDDKVAFFARDVPAGDSTLSYVLRAELPGTCAALPVTISNMYDPSDMASSGDAKVEITK